MQILWQIALAGTQKKAVDIPEHEIPVGLRPMFTRLEAPNPEQRLLRMLTVQELYTRAAWQPRKYSGPFPDQVPVEAEETEMEIVLSVAALPVLQEVIDSAVAQPWMFEEVCQRLAASGRVMPHAVLPELLELARRNPEHGPVIRSVLGTRGRWLAEQRPDWQDVLFPDLDSISTWKTGGPDERVRYLRRLRKTSPSRAATLLLEDWPQLTAQELVRFLPLLETDTGDWDRPVLERAWAHRSREVRRLAVGLYCRIGNHEIAEAIEQTALAQVQAEMRAVSPVVRVVPQEMSWPEAAQLLAGPKRRQSSLGAAPDRDRLVQLFAHVRPTIWETHFESAPEALMAAGLRGPDASVLMRGWLLAADRFGDIRWLEAGLGCWTRAAAPPSFELPPLPGNWPQTVVESEMVRVCHAIRGPLLGPRENHPVLGLVHLLTRPLGKEAAHALWAKYCDPALAVRVENAWNPERILRELNRLAWLFSPDNVPALEAQIPESGSPLALTEHWRQYLQRYLRIIREGWTRIMDRLLNDPGQTEVQSAGQATTA